MDKLETVLIGVTNAFASSGIVWGVGASVLLNRYGLASAPADIDIVVAASDIRKADRILSSLGEKQAERVPDSVYATDYFYEYIIGEVHVDVMAGFKIIVKDAMFEYVFDQSSTPNQFTFGNVSVPFSTLEDWYVLYQLIPGKKCKVELIAGYFRKNGVQYPAAFEKMRMNPTLPENVKLNIEELL